MNDVMVGVCRKVRPHIPRQHWLTIISQISPLS